MPDHGHVFEQHRRRLHGLAYRLLGSVADADDAVQDVYIRWHEIEAGELHSPEAWLTTVLSRLCIDRLRARDRERDAYPGYWLPEPFFVSDPSLPDRELGIADDLSMALLLLLERLTPEERTVFLLHDVFEHNHREIAGILGKAEPASRQLLHRARGRIRTNRPRFKVSNDQCRNLVTSFLQALRSDDCPGLVKLMFENATLISDSGGRVRATLKIIQGSDRIARLLVGVRGKQVGVAIEKLMRINHDLGIVTYVESQAVAILWFEIDDMKIRRVNRILNPDKLKRVPGLGDERRGEVHLTGRMAL